MLSAVYIVTAFPICEKLEAQDILRAASRALFKAGRSIPARIAMIAITIKSSIRVKIRIFTLRRKNIEQGILKKEGTGKHLNNWRKKGKIRQGTN
ncbi:MAG: hypothetical protein V8T87_02180 [Victivallales bacterium]